MIGRRASRQGGRAEDRRLELRYSVHRIASTLPVLHSRVWFAGRRIRSCRNVCSLAQKVVHCGPDCHCGTGLAVSRLRHALHFPCCRNLRVKLGGVALTRVGHVRLDLKD
ncbi:hypothetical protein BC937DRAFT_88572 [Endogone sp. FLAS-F59071]|nr:hypothetical protein BC937DRAFT_88572 [Endogone sp. FLAS-F59071]|eukprot:RUS22541.1 hypothetical protein BC937DRAFT_88572 [Endogone sp. FLAS-F59071]